jgi:NAD(P)-dependent dehydrogenase (short-subunit alcohol dehydrogenase family)
MSEQMAGKVVVVTGGASGIGEATARLMSSEGAHVVVADIQDAAGAKVADELPSAGRYIHCDVTREDDIAAAIDFGVEQFGSVDCVFNNAGIIGALGPVDEMPVEDYDYTMSVLLRSVFLGIKHAARVMKPRRSGVILSTASISGIRGGGQIPYSTAKTAVIGITRAAAAELASFSIRVNAIAPGKMVTPLNAYLRDQEITDMPRALEHLSETIPTPLPGRPGTAEDVAGAALWLASDAAGFMSGHTLVIDGGLTTGTLEVGDPNAHVLRFPHHAPLLREAGQRGIPG